MVLAVSDGYCVSVSNKEATMGKKKTYTVVGVVTLDFTVDIEAESPEEAEELGRQYLEENYLTEDPTGVDSTVVEVC